MSQIDFTHRTKGLLGERGLNALAKPLVAIAGLGGVGGAAFMTLVRSGVKKFHLAENGLFDPPDMNRQWGALAETMDQPKLEVYEKWAKGINPEVEIKAFPEGLTVDNVEDFLRVADIYIGVIDVDKGQDVKEASNRITTKAGIPTFTCGAFGFGSLMINFDPWGMKPDEFWALVEKKSTQKGVFPSYIADCFDEMMMQRLRASYEDGILANCGVGAGQAGVILGSEVIVHLLQSTGLAQRTAVFAPKFVALDLLTLELTIGDASK